MKYLVSKAFKDFDGSFRLPGEAVELDYDRGAKLRSLGLVGGVEPEAPKPPEAAESSAEDKQPAARSEKQLRKLAKKYGIDARGMSLEDLQAAVELAEEEADGEDEAGDGDEREADAEGETPGGDGDKEPA